MSVIWITGGKGFLGRHLARYLAERGCAVYGIGHGLWPLESAGAYGFRSWLNGEVEASNLAQLAAQSGTPTKIFHLAGGSSVGQSFATPLEDFLRTASTTARLLDWVRLGSATTKVLCVSSAAVYGAGWAQAIPESAPIKPYSPYGHHKAVMESIAHSYSENFGLEVGIVRLFSVYGAELRKQLIWDICCKLSSSARGPLPLGGTGNELRDWIHVSDAVRLLVLASDHCTAQAPIWNGATGIATSTRTIAAHCLAAFGIERELAFSGVARVGDPLQLVANIELLKSLTFKPVVPVADGISGTVEWFRSQRSSQL